MMQRMPKSIGIVLFAGSLVAYGYGAGHSPLLDSAKAKQFDYLRQVEKKSDLIRLDERQQAEAYWRTYPDVENHPYFGKNGPLGIFGAREHFRRHGKQEGRRWPK